MNESLIDIIIPVYNGAAFIAEAIASIQAQTFKNFEIMVVDDGSDDDTADIVVNLGKTDPNISLMKQEHLGVQSALNNAISRTKSQYIAFLDADDLWHPQKLEKQLSYITANNIEFCFCLMQEFQDSGTKGQIQTHKARTKPMKGFHKSAFLANRKVFDKYGLFDESVGIGDFVEWYSRVIRTQNSVGMVEEVLAYRRIHNTNTMLNADKNSFLHILKKHLDESRKTNKVK
jgi:glycosyltransferase involved in cell wall biosynthesis